MSLNLVPSFSSQTELIDTPNPASRPYPSTSLRHHPQPIEPLFTRRASPAYVPFLMTQSVSEPARSARTIAATTSTVVVVNDWYGA